MRTDRCGQLNIKIKNGTPCVALMSIQPQFVAEIANGTKQFEYRKAVFKRPVSKVVVYASSPVQKVIGEFTIKHIHQDSPNEIWKVTRLASGITETFFQEYFRGKETAFAIEIEAFTAYEQGFSLNDFAPHLKAPPQSYCYLP